jgi:hypothetical protein
MSWYFFGGFSAYAIVPSARVVNHSGGDERAEVRQRAELRVDRVVPALLGADRPRRADVLRAGLDGVVAALAVDPADRVDRREIDDVEVHRGDGRQPFGGGRECAVLDRDRVRAHLGALGAGEVLVPRGEQGALAVHPDHVRPGGGHQLADRVVPEQFLQVQRGGDPGEQRALVVAQRGGRGADPVLVGVRHDLGGEVERLGALGEIVRQVLEPLAGADLLDHRVAPGPVRIVERLDGERPPPDRVGLDHPVPLVQPRGARAHPGERLGLGVRTLPNHVHAERVVPFAVGHRGDRHELTDHRLRGVAATGHRGRHVFDGKATGHDLHRSQKGAGGLGDQVKHRAC